MSKDWESAYAAGHVATPLDPHLLELAPTLDGETALDLGCGAGQNSIWLAENGWTVTGVDIARSAIRLATAAASQAGVVVGFLTADLAKWTPGSTFDLVVSTYALPPQGPGRSHALATAIEAVAPGGTILITEFERSLGDEGTWSERDLINIDELATHLEALEVERLTVETTRHAHGHNERFHPVAVAVARRPG